MSRTKAYKQAAAMVGVSAEMVRQAHIVCSAYPHAKEQIMSGERTLAEFWREFTGDTSVGIHIKVSPQLRDAINAVARDFGMTRNELLNMILRAQFADYLPQLADDSAENV